MCSDHYRQRIEKMTEAKRNLLEARGFVTLEITANDLCKGEPPEPKYDIIVLCNVGEAVIEMNMQRMKLTERTCLIVSHIFFMHAVSVSPDFHAWVLIVNDNFSLEVSVGMPTEMLEAIFRNPIRTVTNDAEWTMLTNFMQNIHIYDNLDYTTRSIEMAGCIFRCMMITMGEVEMCEQKAEPQFGYTMADTYFRRFIGFIEEHVKQEHEVMFYADKLNITPKYLSEICKQKSGHKAKEIISNVLIAKIKRDILLSGKSVKVIAYDYGFADQSSLGKFFRKLTGQSPSLFKKKNGMKD